MVTGIVAQLICHDDNPRQAASLVILDLAYPQTMGHRPSLGDQHPGRMHPAGQGDCYGTRPHQRRDLTRLPARHYAVQAAAFGRRQALARETVDGMNTALVVALIALAGSVFSSAVTVFGAPALQARHDAKKALDSYREPLLAASYELQARLYNILRLRFVEKYVSDDTAGKRDPAIQSTLYVFAQFFGWQEIIRREVQYLRFSRDKKTREIGRLLRDIGEAFLLNTYGSQFMIWRVEQRGLGECMIICQDGKLSCLDMLHLSTSVRP